MAKPLYYPLFFVLVTMQTTMFAMLDASATGFTLPLIHRHSIHRDVMGPNEMTGPLIPLYTGLFFMVNISVGEPPLPQLLAMDTGSQLCWVQSINCEGCHKAVFPTYDPSKSSTFGPTQKTYSISYADGTKSLGDRATEKFTFETLDEGIVELPNANFGYAHTVVLDESLMQINGILGLAKTPDLLFPESNFTTFSYCIGNISDQNYMYNKLIVGDGANLLGDSVPMLAYYNRREFYIVAVDGISVGDKQIPISSPMPFLIDTGATFSYLKIEPLEALRNEVRALLNGVLNEYPLAEHLCYRGDMRRDLIGFPIVSLSFGGGAGLDLDVEGAFVQLPNFREQVFCLAFREAKGTDQMNVIGIRAQQYYNIGYDLVNWKVSFERIGCEALEG